MIDKTYKYESMQYIGQELVIKKCKNEKIWPFLSPRMPFYNLLNIPEKLFKLKCVHKKSRLARNLHIDKISTIVVLYLLNLVKIIIA